MHEAKGAEHQVQDFQRDGHLWLQHIDDKLSACKVDLDQPHWMETVCANERSTSRRTRTIRFSRETSSTLLGVSAVFFALMISCRFEYCR